MNQVQCRHCGQTFRVGEPTQERDYFCCAGCALRARTRADELGNFPISTDLVGTLVVGFLYFNQLLDWGFSTLLVHQGKLLLAQRFVIGEVVLAIVVWLGLVLLQRRAGLLRGKDYVVTTVALLLLASSFRSTPPDGALLAAANGMLAAWSFRGVLRAPVKLNP